MFGFGKASRPKVVAFDIIGTCFPLEPLRVDIVALGLPAAALEGWFAAGLRDAFALAAVGDFAPFATVLEGALNGLLVEQGMFPHPAEVKAIGERMKRLPGRGGLEAAFRRVSEAGCGVVALSNGSVAATESLLEGAGVRGWVRDVVSVDEVKLSKPRAEVYQRAAAVAGVAVGELALVAVHAWDINGAKAAGLATAWLSADGPYSPVMRRAVVEGVDLVACVEGLLGL